MSINFKQCPTLCDLHSDGAWQDLYISLRPLAKRIVYAFRVPAWRGQENDIAEDIVQETARKVIERTQKADRKEALPIYALKPMVRVIAYNYGKDMRRHDQRVSRIPEQNDLVEQQNVLDEVINTEECATENAYHEVLFTELAREIANFPAKQRQALLIDLATHMSFERQPTPLQKAFLEAGIQLQEYRHLLPATNEERNKYTSLLAHAYRRISTLSCTQAYAAAESGNSSCILS
jgi:DNA-directed RNA polymerase specialized sigma24 family protein